MSAPGLLLANAIVDRRFHCALLVALWFERGFIPTQMHSVLCAGSTNETRGQFGPLLVSAYSEVTDLQVQLDEGSGNKMGFLVAARTGGLVCYALYCTLFFCMNLVVLWLLFTLFPTVSRLSPSAVSLFK